MLPILVKLNDLEQRREFDEAEREALEWLDAKEKFKDSDPAYPQVLCKLAGYYIVNGYLEHAENLLSEASSLSPSEPEIYLGLGRIYLRRHEIGNAIACYDTARHICDPHAEVWAGPARVNSMTGNYYVAEKQYEELSRQFPGTAFILYEWAEAALQNGNREKAARIFTRVSGNDAPSDLDIYAGPARIAFFLKDYERAKDLYSKLARKFPAPEVYIEWGRVACLNSDITAMDQIYSAGARKFPGHTGLITSWANCHRRFGYFEQARKILQKIPLAQRDRPVLRLFARIHRELTASKKEGGSEPSL